MKRFLSVLLVAILIVTSLSIVAFAAGTATVTGTHANANPGDTVDITFTVAGEFANYEMNIALPDGFTLTNITGVVGNINNGAVAHATAENITSHSFTVSVKVPENAKAGTYQVQPMVDFISDRNLVDQEVSVSNGTITITIACDHDYKLIDSKEPTCTEAGYKTYECSKCGHTYTENIQAAGHKVSTEWKYNPEKHWHICEVCGEEFDHSEHGSWQYDVIKPATKEEDGLETVTCGVCGYNFNRKIDKEKDEGGPTTGDITPVIALSVTSVITLAGTSLYVFKRKNAK